MPIAHGSDQSSSQPVKVASFVEGLCSKARLKKILFIALILITSILLVRAGFSSRHPTHPTTPSSRPKYRIAHCMTGSPRTLYKEEVYVAYRRQALDQLPGDLFVVLKLLNKTELVHDQTIKASPPETYDAALKYLSPRKIEWIPADDHLGAIEDLSGYSKWKRCLEHIEAAEKHDGVKYDFIVRGRPDLYVAKDLPTADILPKDRILINPYYECPQDIPSGYSQRWSDIQAPCDKRNFGISDMFAIIPRALAKPYMHVGYIPNLPRHICGTAYPGQECLLRAVLFKENITFEIWPFVVKVMRPADFCHLVGWNPFNSWC